MSAQEGLVEPEIPPLRPSVEYPFGIEADVPGLADGYDGYLVAATVTHSLMPISEAEKVRRIIIERVNGWDALVAEKASLESELAEVQRRNAQADIVRAENARLLTLNAGQARALEPFADFAELMDLESEGFSDSDKIYLFADENGEHFIAAIELGKFKAARAALAGHEQAVTTMNAEQMREAAAKICETMPVQIYTDGPTAKDRACKEATFEDAAAHIRALPASPGKGAE